MSDQTVTEFVAHYPMPPGDNWTEIKTNWNQNALNAWLAVAHEKGLAVTVREVTTSSYIVGIVEVDGREYAVRHLGRAMELQAELR